MQGWIKLHRKLMDKPIWLDSTPEQKVILVTLLTMANHKEKEWEFAGEVYKAEAGQFVTSLNSIVLRSGKGITIQNVRTALIRFEKYKFLTSKSTNRNRLITIVNWCLYQQEETKETSGLTSNQQATNKQLTTNKNVKNERMKEEDRTEQTKELVQYFSESIDNFSKYNKEYWDVIRSTRVNNKVSASIILREMDKWKKYHSKVVEYAIRTHVKSYPKTKENYTLGIMRNTDKEEAIDKLSNWNKPKKRGFDINELNFDD